MQIAWTDDIRPIRLAEVQRGFFEELGFLIRIEYFGNEKCRTSYADIVKWPTYSGVKEIFRDAGITGYNIKSWATGADTLTVRKAIEIAKLLKIYDVRLGTGDFTGDRSVVGLWSSDVEDRMMLATVQQGFLEDLGFRIDQTFLGESIHRIDIKEWPFHPHGKRLLREAGVACRDIRAWATGSASLTLKRALIIARAVDVHDVRLGVGFVFDITGGVYG